MRFDISTGVFDEAVDRRGTHCAKWDMMQANYGVAPGDGLAMWVADMDFRPPAGIQRAVERMAAHGIYGYFGDDGDYLEAIRWWMQVRHGWAVEPHEILTTHGLVNATALCIDAFTQPGDGVVLMSPVYHAFARITRAAGRELVECPLALVDGRYEMDFPAWDAQMTGRERLLILCSPHNPGGRVWSAAELEAAAGFARRHGLILVSDEIHHDLVYPGQRHRMMACTVPGILDRLVMLTSASKTFGIAGAHTGNLIVPDPALRKRLAGRLAALGLSPNAFGMNMVPAAYSPEGAAWVDALMLYLDGNRRLFDRVVGALPGLRSMPLEATYLSWVDFSRTGLSDAAVAARVEGQARIAANHGATFGRGGEGFMRFNLAMPRARVAEAAGRLAAAFADLQ